MSVPNRLSPLVPVHWSSICRLIYSWDTSMYHTWSTTKTKTTKKTKQKQTEPILWLGAFGPSNKKASRLKAHFFISDTFRPCSLTIAGNLFWAKHWMGCLCSISCLAKELPCLFVNARDCSWWIFAESSAQSMLGYKTWGALKASYLVLYVRISIIC